MEIKEHFIEILIRRSFSSKHEAFINSYLLEVFTYLLSLSSQIAAQVRFFLNIFNLQKNNYVYIFFQSSNIFFIKYYT